MKIRATFINRKHDPSLIELAHAWDEFCIDENWEGYEADLREELASYQDDVLKVVTVDIKVDYTLLDRLFLETPVLTGTLSSVED